MAVLVCIDDFERYAFQHLPRNALDYYRSGANDEQTLKDNRLAFSRLRLKPRVLRDVSKRCHETTILGDKIKFPICVSPTAMQRMAHPDGEVATAKAAESVGTAMILSTIATSSIEEIAEGAPSLLKWFQLYIYRDRKITQQLVIRAEKAGYKAIVLTVDTPMFGLRLADARNKFKLPSHLRMKNFDQIGIKSTGVQKAKNESGLNEYAASLFDPSITWKDILWLRQITHLPIIVKAEDALLSLEHGASAIMVSNHGARQLDGVPATIDVLPEIVKAVNGRCEVYLDGGIRTGTDVLKALALGARAVFMGRPLLWGLTYDVCISTISTIISTKYFYVQLLLLLLLQEPNHLSSFQKSGISSYF
ncbi:Hydroxyacid oxidase 1 [Nymphon striatum]|nr:Hydroxyacid oxidase 1 [Nymphon striatum]